VQDVAVESMTDNSAVVLVVAKSDTINPDKSKRPPVFWRLSVNVDRDGGQLKLSKLDFVQ
jgi:Mce-associated membrane protein